MIQNTAIQIKKFLSGKYLTVAIISIAVISRIVQLIYFFNIGFDMCFQVAATKNFVGGHGISLDTVTATDLSKIIYTPVINWPPGYSIILSPFYILAGENYLVAGLALSIIAALVLIFTSRGILKLLQLPLYLINLYTLIAGFFIYFFYFIPSTDAVMISIFFVCLYYTISLIITNSRWKTKTVIITVCLFVCASLKFLFVPAAFVIPAFLILKGYADKNDKWKKSGIYSFLFLTLLVGFLLGYQYYISNSVGYISAEGRGFFPSNLLSTHPFVPGSVIRIESIGLLINSPFTETLLTKVFQLLHLAFLIGASVYLIRRVFKKGFKNLSAVASFFYIAFFISISITVLLAALSLTVEKELWASGYLWTYVEDQRYYGVANIFVHTGIFIAYWHMRPAKKKTINYIFCFLFILLFMEVVRGIIFDINRVKKFKKKEYSWQSENRFQQFADSIIKKEKSNSQIEKAIVTGTSYYMNFRVLINSHVPVLKDVSKINNLSSLNTKYPVFLLVILNTNVLPAFRTFLSRKEVKAAGNFEGFSFYIVHLGPN